MSELTPICWTMDIIDIVLPYVVYLMLSKAYSFAAETIQSIL